MSTGNPVNYEDYCSLENTIDLLGGSGRAEQVEQKLDSNYLPVQFRKSHGIKSKKGDQAPDNAVL